jgi:serine/threonine-protein kinase RsbW
MEQGMTDDDARQCEFDIQNLIVRLDLTISANVKAIDPAVERIMNLVAEMTCGEGREFEIETAIREALANAIVHGCGEDSKQTVRVSVGCDESRGMIIVVRDPGPGFDPAELPSPVEGENLFAESGRGIYLINRLMDEVRFRAGGTEIWMRKHPGK